MAFMYTVIDFILHVDTHLNTLILTYDARVYLIIFGIVFVETGIVIMPFLPGDSLLFVIGVFAARGSLNIWISLLLLFFAAVLGDTVNYHIGKIFGMKICGRTLFGKVLVKQEHIDKTQSFFKRYGKKTIILARFVPIVRTFAPFVAGIGHMSYKTFLTYNIIGAAIWVFGITLLGYFFGGIPFVQEHFEKFVLGILVVSILPILFEIIKSKMKKRKK